jgi:hypothetical protein
MNGNGAAMKRCGCVEAKCDGHGHRIFVATHDGAVGQNVIVMADPTCPGFVRGEEPGVGGSRG